MMEMEREDRRVSDWELERYLMREGSASELADLDRRVAADPAVAQRLAALERSNEELLRRYPPAWMGRQIEQKLKRARSEGVRRSWSGYRFWVVPAMALILAVVAVPTLFEQSWRDPEVPAAEGESVGPDRGTYSASPGVESMLRVKGDDEGPRLVIFRKLAGGSERLRDGAPARSGDLVQIAYRSGGLAYGAILSVDGRKAVTQHLPASGEKAVPLAPRDTLDFAYELDDAPHWERFFLVAGDRPFGLEGVREELSAGDVKLAGGLRLYQVTLKKPRSP